MKNIILEYIWLDGYETPNLRSKVKVIRKEDSVSLDDCPTWNFDGSSCHLHFFLFWVYLYFAFHVHHR
mgnify:CR=1 FL=1